MSKNLELLSRRARRADSSFVYLFYVCICFYFVLRQGSQVSQADLNSLFLVYPTFLVLGLQARHMKFPIRGAENLTPKSLTSITEMKNAISYQLNPSHVWPLVTTITV